MHSAQRVHCNADQTKATSSATRAHLDDITSEPLRPYIEVITQVRDQDLEEAESGGVRIREGVAPDRPSIANTR